jgi:hypothetical protein
MRNAGNSGLWKKYAATIHSGATPPLLGADANLNKPPRRRPRVFISYSAVVQKETSTKVKQQSQNMEATMAASAISGANETGPVFEGFVDLKRKLAEIDAERNRYSAQQQKVEYDVSTMTQSMHKMASDVVDTRKDMNGLSTQMKEITELLKKRFNMKLVEMNMITSLPCKRRTGKKGSGSVSSNEETNITWASDCDSDMNFERERGERRTATTDADGDS